MVQRLSLSSLVHTIPFSIVKAVSEDSLQNGSRKGSGETFWNIILERKMNDRSIQIIEKPDWVSWDDIKQCLFEAHSVNRAKGINMDHYQWPTEKIKESLGENGFMLVALDGDKVVGTAGIGEKFGNKWYSKGRYAYMCFAAQ